MVDSTIQKLKDKLSTLLRQKELAAQKAKMLEEQATRDRQREDTMTQLVQQLIDRQRELNIMLNRSNLMLNRSHEANLALSLEFTELCRALPAPEDPEVMDRIKRINDLFTKTGIEDAELASAPVEGAYRQPDSSIVTPPPQDQDSQVEADEPQAEETEEMTIEGIVREFVDEPVPEPEIRPVITSSLEELFKRTGMNDSDPVIEVGGEEDAVPGEPEPVAAETSEAQLSAVELETDGAAPEESANGGRRWWQLLSRR